MKETIALILVVLLATTAGVYAGRKPREIAKEESAKLVVQEQRVQAAEAENARLLKREAELRSSIGYEKFVRSRGYIGANEVPAPPVASDSSASQPN